MIHAILLALALHGHHQGEMRYAVVSTSSANRTRLSTCIADRRCHQTRVNAARVSPDGSRMIVKWRGRTTPSSIGVVVPLTHAQMLALLSTDPAWQGPDS